MPNIPQGDRCTAEQVAYVKGYEAAQKAKSTGIIETVPFTSEAMSVAWENGYQAFFKNLHEEQRFQDEEEDWYDPDQQIGGDDWYP